jgi:putative acetyltransferase
MSAPAATIRPEGPKDLPAIRRVLTETFPTPDEADLVDQLRAAGALSASLVAWRSDLVVGHIAFSPVTLEPPASVQIRVLAPLAVAPSSQQRGIGTELVRAGLQTCRDAGCAAVVVLGHPAYYRRFGFRPAAQWGLRCLFASPPEAFMLATLRDDAAAVSSGVVHFHPAFDRWLQ